MSTQTSLRSVPIKKTSGAFSSALQKPKPINLPSRVVIDPDGELCLAVGGQTAITTFVVCPKTLSRASPFFKKLLYGGFAESTQPDRTTGEEWIVRLPDDNPKAMGVILNMLHACFETIPTSVCYFCDRSRHPFNRCFDYWDLYQLAQLTDKYDLTRILRPWAKDWVKDISPHATSPLLCIGYSGRPATFVELLSWIAWELGDIATFKSTAKHLILNCTMQPGGGLRLEGPFFKRLFAYSIEPAGLSSFIEDRRLETIRKMLDPLRKVVTRLTQVSKDNSKPLCTGCRYEVDCEVTMLGAIVRSLTPSGLYPIPKPEDISISIMELADKLKATDSKSRLNGHKCTALPKDVGETFFKAGPELTELQVKHLKAQAKKTGLGA
ncbi:hypothetical protein F5Y05DRAFT_397810 [Hypoxylon sp. FL0543]|nr:hypothetical protein F5Y05DRAFT_397810 [Hypoxylon sp. FL0543]